MKASSAIATTSTRLNREIELLPEVEAQKQAITERTIAYCHESLDRSYFFSKLKNGEMTQSLMQYAFLQYRLWRDRLHQWFGLCIVKAESCTDPDLKAAIMSLADHTFTDLQDNHSEMYLEFLHDLGLDNAAIQGVRRSAATVLYERSFFDDFGYETNNFYQALAALSGRELCVTVRNERILQYYFDIRSLKHPVWLALHAELEIEHFHDSILPVLTRYAGNPAEIADLMKAVERGIDRHVQYFEAMLHEYESI
jgi:pyrroloquinoline quinone (PQQ) biosynthesis protein C